MLTSTFEKGETYNEREFIGILRKTIRQIRKHRGYFEGSSVQSSETGYGERSKRSTANDGQRIYGEVQSRIKQIKYFDTKGRGLNQYQLDCIFDNDERLFDENEKIISLYHGTSNGKIAYFDKTKVGSNYKYPIMEVVLFN